MDGGDKKKKRRRANDKESPNGQQKRVQKDAQRGQKHNKKATGNTPNCAPNRTSRGVTNRASPGGAKKAKENNQKNNDSRARATATNPHHEQNHSTASPKGPKCSITPWTDRHAKRALRGHNSMRKYVLSALMSPDVEQVGKMLANYDEARENLRQLLSADYKVYNAEFPFQRIAVPLCDLMNRLANNARTSDTRKVLSEVCKIDRFIPTLVSCLEECSRRDIVKDPHHQEERTAHDYSTFDELATPVCECLLQILRIDQDEAHQDRWPSTIDRLQRIISDRSAPKAKKVLDRCYQIVDAAQRKQKTQERAIIEERLKKDESLAMQMQMGAEYAMPTEENDLPGNLRDQGPRHDNDDEEFRNINVLPTTDEMKSTILPYLPCQHLLNKYETKRGSAFVSDSVDRHLDIQFRLLREDMLAPIRGAVQACHRNIADINEHKKQWTWHHPDATGDACRYLTFRNCNISNLNAIFFYGGSCLTLEFDHPVPEEGKDFWESGRGSRLLQRDSLVGFVLNAAEKEVIFAKVSGRVEVIRREVVTLVEESPKRAKAGKRNKANKRTKQAKKITYETKQCRVSVYVIDHENDIPRIINFIKTKVDRETLLLQVRGHMIVAHESVLSSLQRHSAATLPFLNRLVPELDGVLLEDREIQLPQYITPTTRFDFNCLVETPSDKTALLRDVQVQSYRQLVSLLEREDVRPRLRLDDAQIRAFATAFTRDVALIQGPPGTGKTFVGVEIMRTLVHNSGGKDTQQWQTDEQGRVAPPLQEINGKPLIFPIICICYTNHALDQFLEELLDNQIVSIDDVVRVGGSSRSERMLPCNLRTRARQHRSKHDSYEYAIARKEADTIEEDLNQIADQLLKKGFNANEKLKDFLIDEYPDLYESLMGTDEDGFEVAGGFKNILKDWQRRNPDQWAVVSRDYEEYLCEEYAALVNDYNGYVEKCKEVNLSADLRTFHNAKVVGMTTSGCAKYDSLLRAIGPRVVICEEAGEVMESHLLASLTFHTKSLILIGDHQQLRPKPTVHTLSVESGKGFDLDISLFERLVSSRLPKETLEVQRRMQPNISALIRDSLYPNLKDAKNVFDHPPVMGLDPFRSLSFFDHDHFESQDNLATSKKNIFEAEMIVSLARYFVKQGYAPSNIAILTPYVAQLLELKRRLRNIKMTVYVDSRTLEEVEFASGEAVTDVETDIVYNEDEDEEGFGSKKSTGDPRVAVKKLGECVRLATVDNFQGEEADLVLISTVRCNARGNYSQIGFLKIDNRVNVMLSRARHGMIILGSSATIKRSRSNCMFMNVLRQLEDQDAIVRSLPLMCQTHGIVTDVSSASDVPSDGGCQMECRARMSCGHTCKRLCHPDDPKHIAGTCTEPCIQLLECGHPCRGLCHEKCKKCTQMVDYRLPCGHQCKISCREACELSKGKKWKCKKTVVFEPVTLPCGHSVSQAPCFELSSKSITCTEQCSRMMDDCNHRCPKKCSDCSDDSDHSRNLCLKECGRTLLCGHNCSATPCHDASDCPSCEQTCSIRCIHSNCDKLCKELCYPCMENCQWKHTCGESDEHCTARCSSPCVRLPCNLRCSLILSCGHRCAGICGEKCPSPCWECVSTSATSIPGSDQIVDVIEYASLQSHVVEDNVYKTLLLEAECGHLATVESLDEYHKMDMIYQVDDSGNFVSSNPMSEILSSDSWEVSAQCITCRQAISGINRYNRITKLKECLLLQKKWYVATQSLLAETRSWCESFLAENFPDFKAAVSKVKKQIKACQLTCYLPKFNNKSPVEMALKMSDLSNVLKVQAATGHACVSISVLLLHLCQARVESTLCDPTTKKCKKGNACKSRLSNFAHKDRHFLGPYVNRVSDSLRSIRLTEVPQCLQYLKNCKSSRLLSEFWSALANHLLSVFDNLKEMMQCEPSPTDDVLKQIMNLRKELCDQFDEMLEQSDGLLDPLEKLFKNARNHCMDTFYTDVTQSERQMILAAMAPDVGSGVGSFGGHWFQCPNGHVYAIGECGGAVATAKCAECGADIGGTRHTLNADNSVATEFLRDAGGPVPQANWEQLAPQF